MIHPNRFKRFAGRLITEENTDALRRLARYSHIIHFSRDLLKILSRSYLQKDSILSLASSARDAAVLFFPFLLHLPCGPLCKLLHATISRVYRIEWILGTALFIAGTRELPPRRWCRIKRTVLGARLTFEVASTGLSR